MTSAVEGADVFMLVRQARFPGRGQDSANFCVHRHEMRLARVAGPFHSALPGDQATAGCV